MLFRLLILILLRLAKCDSDEIAGGKPSGMLRIIRYPPKPVPGKLINFASPSAYLSNYGGPILSRVEVTPLFYGQVKYQNELIKWYSAIVNSTHMDLCM